ncbi:MAG TPA: hypothetical protein VGP38_01445 [Rubrobacter sp.]|nr:hypothetical protein [Rubrobacter sp.]
MSLRSEVSALVAAIKAQKPYLAHNAVLFDIFEGNLLDYIIADLKSELSPQSFEQILHRIPPINLLRRVVDKLSKIYQQAPARTVLDGTEADVKLLGWYERKMGINRTLNQGNEFFNLFKNCLLQPFVNGKGQPRLRAIPSDRFVTLSRDSDDPTRPTHTILLAGTRRDPSGAMVDLYYGYTDEEIVIFNSKNEVETAMMAELGNPEGSNRFGKMPFVYVNRSLNCVMPKQDTDTLVMTKLIPVLLADLGFAVKFQAFSIMYGIDLDDEGLKMAPNAFWRFKSGDGEKTPSIGSIKPQVDIDQVLGFIQAMLSIWLQSKNIRPGSVGQMTEDNFSSGISKLVDEMDTSEDRQKQVEFFKPAEEELWDLVMHHMHPYWSENGLIDTAGARFTDTAKVETNFAEQLPLVRRGELVKDLSAEVQAGFTTKKAAVAKLNPQWTQAEVEAHMEEIKAEKAAATPPAFAKNAPPFGKKPEEEEEEEDKDDEEKQDEEAPAA